MRMFASKRVSCPFPNNPSSWEIIRTMFYGRKRHDYAEIAYSQVSLINVAKVKNRRILTLAALTYYAVVYSNLS
jgi:hypothetical protein